MIFVVVGSIRSHQSAVTRWPPTLNKWIGKPTPARRRTLGTNTINSANETAGWLVGSPRWQPTNRTHTCDPIRNLILIANKCNFPRPSPSLREGCFCFSERFSACARVIGAMLPLRVIATVLAVYIGQVTGQDELMGKFRICKSTDKDSFL